MRVGARRCPIPRQIYERRSTLGNILMASLIFFLDEVRHLILQVPCPPSLGMTVVLQPGTATGTGMGRGMGGGACGLSKPHPTDDCRGYGQWLLAYAALQRMGTACPITAPGAPDLCDIPVVLHRRPGSGRCPESCARGSVRSYGGGATRR